MQSLMQISQLKKKLAKCNLETIQTMKMPLFTINSLLRNTVHSIRTKFFTVILHHIRVLYVQWYQNRVAAM